MWVSPVQRAGTGRDLLMTENVIRVSALSALRGIVPTPIHDGLVAEWLVEGRELPAEVGVMADNAKEFCWSRGPRIGDEGSPICFRADGHSGTHQAHPDAGFGTVHWCDPRWEVPASERVNYWTPKAVA